MLDKAGADSRGMLTFNAWVADDVNIFSQYQRGEDLEMSSEGSPLLNGHGRKPRGPGFSRLFLWGNPGGTIFGGILGRGFGPFHNT